MTEAYLASALPIANSPPPPRIILLVDDEPDVLESARELLERGMPGFMIRTANSGAEALTMLDRVDLIVADYRMPDMDGIGLLAHCLYLRPNAKRILMTAFPGPVPELENRARREANVAAFVSKGLGPVALLEAVRSVMVSAPLHGLPGAATPPAPPLPRREPTPADSANFMAGYRVRHPTGPLGL